MYLSKSAEIYALINAPKQILSIEHVKSLVDDKLCLTLIEEPFFVQIRNIVTEIYNKKVTGDIVFVGIFKGGAALYMSELFYELGLKNKIWLFDSFKGFNRPNLSYEKDIEMLNHIGTDEYFESLVSVNDIFTLFKKFELEKNLNIIPGYVEETLNKLNIESIAFLHIDVDCYEPTLYTLQNLYPKLNKGGWCVVDDYFVKEFSCKEATDAFREKNNSAEPLVKIGNYSVGWEKQI